MFGLLIGLFNVGRLFHDWHKEGKRNTHAIERARANGDETYIDYNGVRRYQKNSHAVYVYRTVPALHCGAGDLCIKDLETGEIRNLDVEKIIKNFNKIATEAKEEGKTVIPFGNDRHVDSVIPGQRFVDIETGRIFVKVFASQKNYKTLDKDIVIGEYYFDIKTHELIRYTDEERRRSIDTSKLKYIKDARREREEYHKLVSKREEEIKRSDNFVAQWNGNPELRAKAKVVGDLDKIIIR